MPVPADLADDAAPFAMEIVVCGAVAVMRLVGELDLMHRERTDAALDALLATTAPTVVLDLSGLTFVDAHSLHTWRTVGASLAVHGRELVVREPSPFIRRLLAETNVVDFARVEPDPS